MTERDNLRAAVEALAEKLSAWHDEGFYLKRTTGPCTEHGRSLDAYVVRPLRDALAEHSPEPPSEHECDTGNFDRTICPEPCGRMHSYCDTCGERQDDCAHEPARRPGCAHTCCPYPGLECGGDSDRVRECESSDVDAETLAEVIERLMGGVLGPQASAALAWGLGRRFHVTPRPEGES
jgi:hypothetical protein